MTVKDVIRHLPINSSFFRISVRGLLTYPARLVCKVGLHGHGVLLEGLYFRSLLVNLGCVISLMDQFAA